MKTATSTAAVILCAGDSSRMGRSKALLHWGGTSLVRHLVGCFVDSGCHPVVVVVGGMHSDSIRLETASMNGVSVVTNPDPSRGMLSSLQIGLQAAMATGMDEAVFCPVDVPLAGGQSVKALLEAAAGRFSVATAGFNGQAGHPTLVSRSVASALLAIDIDSQPAVTARSVLSSHSPALVPLADPGVIVNLNTPEQVDDWFGRQGKRHE